MAETIEEIIYNLFVNRNDCFAEQQPTKDKYYKVNAPITLNRITEHLNGNTIGVYQLNKENKIKWICFDFDNEDDPNQAIKEALKLEKKIKEKTKATFTEYSGRKGAHVWLFIKPTKALNGKFFAKQISKEFKCEIFPKQETINQYGNLVKLPFGIHLITGNPSYLINRQGKIASFQTAELLKKINDMEKIEIPFVKELTPQRKQNIEVANPTTQETPGVSQEVTWLIELGCMKGERHLSRYKIAKELYATGHQEKEIRQTIQEFNSKCKPQDNKETVIEHLNKLFKFPEIYFKQKKVVA